ncbi:trimeric intracellular cation channel family protein [Nibrella saemangeumensis]|uniref:Trimeric intracellular cation channel family protein n=1 Tax=Nibrella saemangeumensis TaxID=1084526 RepID=A0ABP8N5S1_9BACT
MWFDNLSVLFDVGGTVSFAVSGALAAMNKRLDPFGVLVVAFVTAVGGGTLRDMLLGDTPVSWMRHEGITLLIVFTTTVAMFLKRYVERLRFTLLLFDSLGLGLFTTIGIAKGMAYGLHPGICIALGTMTGCFGGVIRDVLLNEVPVIFHKELYASVCIMGGLLYYLLKTVPWLNPLAGVLTIVFILSVRLIAVRYKLALPKWYM